MAHKIIIAGMVLILLVIAVSGICRAECIKKYTLKPDYEYVYNNSTDGIYWGFISFIGLIDSIPKTATIDTSMDWIIQEHYNALIDSLGIDIEQIKKTWSGYSVTYNTKPGGEPYYDSTYFTQADREYNTWIVLVVGMVALVFVFSGFAIAGKWISGSFKK